MGRPLSPSLIADADSSRRSIALGDNKEKQAIQLAMPGLRLPIASPLESPLVTERHLAVAW